jgi:hypothetical protein
MFVYSSRGKCVFPPHLCSFPPSATLTSFPAPVCWARALPLLQPEALRPAWLVYLQFIYSPRKGSLPPIFSVQCTPPSFLHVLFVLIAYYSVSLFFLGWRSVFPGGYAALAQACLWEYRSTVKLTWSVSSQAVCALATGGLGALISPFNVKWRFSAPAGGVERSKLCLFSVIMPAKCVSGVSPRFHYRRLTFCFLPLAAILESPSSFLYSNNSNRQRKKSVKLSICSSL